MASDSCKYKPGDVFTLMDGHPKSWEELDWGGDWRRMVVKHVYRNDKNWVVATTDQQLADHEGLAETYVKLLDEDGPW